MHFTTYIAPALLVLSEMASAKAIIHLPNAIRRRDYSHEVKKVADKLLRRATVGTDVNLQPQSFNGLLPLSEPDSALNQSIATACLNSLQSVTGVENDAGLTACYNILQYDPKLGAFMADLRLYQAFQPKGAFANITVSDIQIGVKYPSSTRFQSVPKSNAKKRDLEERQSTSTNSSMTEIEQYLLMGSFLTHLDIKKLNNTQLMSLMLPEIQLNTAESQKAVSANMTSGEGAWFVIGEFSSDFDEKLVTPAAAKNAIEVALPFILPGVTLGIFPTGLIITMAWTGLFFLAYGLGTFGRIRYRDAYRKRMAASAGRTGKRI
ncbi:hypothetical protein LTR84_006051 [Exophiala bonariae]|uniref:Protein BIG1 n=1 Tax=Exophiala bonariae TaxID=1690606 RepID=A0AAV9N3L0_9EURO|nr:hypothetical protein LTR84_006051 [Exophiala bonariae]